MKDLISVPRRDANRALEGTSTNGINYPTALKLLKVCQLNLNEHFEQPEKKKMVKCHNTWLLGYTEYHHTLKSTKTLDKAVQRLSNYLGTSFYKYLKFHLNDARTFT